MNKLYRIIVILIVLLLIPSTIYAADPELDGPLTKEDCKKGGWQNYEHLGFRNQGDCIRFVQTGGFECQDPLGCITYYVNEPLQLATAFDVHSAIIMFPEYESKEIQKAA